TGPRQAGITVAPYAVARPLRIAARLDVPVGNGGAAKTEGHGIAVDADGAVYVSGETDSSDFPTTARAVRGTAGDGGFDAFVAKLNPQGTALVYATYRGGDDEDGGQGIAVDAAGNAYVTGYTPSRNFPTTAGAFDTSFHGGLQDAFVTKLSAAGSAFV